MPTNFGFIDILSITGPIFIIIGIGYLAVKYEIFPKNNVRSLGLFVINFALPALLFKAVSDKDIETIFNLNYFLSYGIGSLLAFSLIFFIIKKSGSTLQTSAIAGMGSSFSNTGFVGYPIILSYLGTEALVGVALSMILENIILFPVVLAIAEHATSDEKKFFPALINAFKNLIKNPIVIAIGLGITFSIFKITPPQPINKVVGMLASASGAIALFAIGGVLVGLKIKGMIKNISLITLGKLIIHPLMVFLVICLLPPFDPVLQVVAVVLACMPMMSIYPILGQKYGEEDNCAASLLLATVVSFFTITLMIWILNHFYWVAK
jgi:predicted permease